MGEQVTLISEVVYRVKKGTDPVLRPDITESDDIRPSLISLVKHCWSEDPEKRPVAKEICDLLLEWAPKYNE